jgi:hypothetical protein
LVQNRQANKFAPTKTRNRPAAIGELTCEGRFRALVAATLAPHLFESAGVSIACQGTSAVTPLPSPL